MTTSTRLPLSGSRTRLSRLAAASLLALSLAAAPAFAAEDVVDEGAEQAEETGSAESEEEEGSGKIQLAETPRDRVGLMVLGFLGVITLGGAITAARQLGGKRPQATGEFRWR
jgi:hypothetical protein